MKILVAGASGFIGAGFALERDLSVRAKDFSLDIGRAREFLDHEPQVSLWTVLDEFCLWCKARHPG